MSSDFFIPPTHHLEGLEDMAVRLEQEGKFETALETYRQALAREGNMTDRGRRFETRIAELEARLRKDSKPKEVPWYQTGVFKGVLIGIIVMLGIYLVLSFFRKPAQPVADTYTPPPLPSATVESTPKPAPSPSPTVESTPTPAAPKVLGDPVDLIRQNYKFLARGDYESAEKLRSANCLSQEAKIGGLRAIYHHAAKVPTQIQSIEVVSSGETRVRAHAHVLYHDDGRTHNMEFIFENEGGRWKIAEIPHDV